MKRIAWIISLLLLFAVYSVRGQEIRYARELIADLSSPSMHGRGYVKKGDLKAAKYIRKQFRKLGVTPLGEDYFQYFNLNINTFPGKIRVVVDNQTSIPGKDFVLYASSPSIKGTFELVYFENDSATESDLQRFNNRSNLSGKFLVINRSLKEILERISPKRMKGIIYLTDKKLWWHVSRGRKVNELVRMEMKDSILADKPGKISITAKNNFRESYQSQNVIGYIRGKIRPDSFLVFTAHYDHLGRMGKETYFPGANDNASGTAMIIDLARHYSQPENQPDLSVVFIAFAGEEAGLVGSSWFAYHPLIPLKKIGFLTNLDMVGTGSNGITLVNGTVLKDAFDSFVQINQEKKYLKEVKARGESCNSDHCMFYKQGVPAVFIYTRGGKSGGYHRIDDVAENLSLTEYEDLFRLLVDFYSTFN